MRWWMLGEALVWERRGGARGLLVYDATWQGDTDGPLSALGGLEDGGGFGGVFCGCGCGWCGWRDLRV